MKRPQPIENAANADLRGSWPALQRAARRARTLAAQTGTAVVVMRNGTLEYLYPQPNSTPIQVQEPATDIGKPR
jgi:hypothetical protein